VGALGPGDGHGQPSRRTPTEVYEAKVKARPPARRTATHFRVRRDRIDKAGRVTLRHDSRLLHIGVGRAHTGTRVLLLVADLDVRIVNEDGELLRNSRSTGAGTTSPSGRPDVSDVSRHHIGGGGRI
jgi:hypothetical protein